MARPCKSATKHVSLQHCRARLHDESMRFVLHTRDVGGKLSYRRRTRLICSGRESLQSSGVGKHNRACMHACKLSSNDLRQLFLTCAEGRAAVVSRSLRRNSRLRGCFLCRPSCPGCINRADRPYGRSSVDHLL